MLPQVAPSKLLLQLVAAVAAAQLAFSGTDPSMLPTPCTTCKVANPHDNRIADAAIASTEYHVMLWQLPYLLFSVLVRYCRRRHQPAYPARS